MALDQTLDPVMAIGAWFLEPAHLGALLRAILYLVLGVVLARAARYAVRRTSVALSEQQRQLLARVAYYGILGLFSISALRQFGFDFTVLLGAAGIVTVALGFASQTSAANMIAGLFMIVEKAVNTGDIITVDDVTGEVLSVDLLSTKLRTFDNLQVRIPNETMVKARITTLNRFPLRRVDVNVGVSYASDLALVQETLQEVARANPLCLDEPGPLVIWTGFGDSSINYLFAVWGKAENFLTLRNSITREIKAAFDAAGIEIPFPQRTLQPGGTPLEVRLYGPSGGSEEGSGSRPERSRPERARPEGADAGGSSEPPPRPS
jgi:small-conductance mechanosensitive channel